MNHTFLWHKLITAGVNGNMIRTIRSMYSNLQSCVRLNGNITDWFSVETGVRQGDNLAPTLFALFINDLTLDINSVHCGISLDTDLELSILLYADDVVLMSDSADGLQNQLTALNNWSVKWNLRINSDKTKIVHCRKASSPRSTHNFKLGDKSVDYVSAYRYLGFTISETLDYTVGVSELGTASSRALGALTSKYFKIGGLDYDTFTKVFDSTVIPIMTYSSGVWGYKVYDKLERLQYRAIRTFLGVGKTTPIPAICGDFGWTPIHIKQHCNIVRLWHRIVSMNAHRIPHKIFMWDANFSHTHRCTWYNEVKSIMDICEMMDLFQNNYTNGLSAKFVCSQAETMLLRKHKEQWTLDVDGMPKLRTFKLLDSCYEVQPYVKANITRQQRSVLARMRCGTYSLEIEKGRYRGIPAVRRFCKMCRDNQTVEDEKHFLIHCPSYSEERNTFFIDFQLRNNTDFSNMNDTEILKLLLSIDSKFVADFIINISNIRNHLLSV